MTQKEIRGNFYCSKNNLTTLEGVSNKRIGNSRIVAKKITIGKRIL